MTSISLYARRGAFCAVLLFSLLFCGASPAWAVQESACSGGTAPEDCQYVTASKEAAPLPTNSMGIRLHAGASDVLFSNYSPAIPPYFISNSSDQDLFVPQSSQEEFQAFINSMLAAKLAYVTWGYAVPSATYTASPPVPANCSMTPPSQSVTVPKDVTKTTPPTVSVGDVTRLDAGLMNTPFALSTTVTPVLFTQNRNDCSKDDETNRACTPVSYVNTQTIVFKAQGASPVFSWNTKTPVVTNLLTMSVNGGAAQVVADCSTTQAPVLTAVCGSNNGADLAQAPTTGLCSRGDSSVVSAYQTDYGIRWGWTCYDVQGTATGIENNRLGTGSGCGACQDRAKQTISACSATCGGGQQTVTWYDGCGEIQVQYQQACNTQNCPINGACGPANGVGTYSWPSWGYCNAGSAVDGWGNGSAIGWTCTGQYGGAPASCWAPILPPVISIQSASYGSNCGVSWGNVTGTVASICNGQASCTFQEVNWLFGDPAGGCPKDFWVYYNCTNGGTKSAYSPPLTNEGYYVTLSCP